VTNRDGATSSVGSSGTRFALSNLPRLLGERASVWGGADGSAWLAELPNMVEGLVRRWDLTLGPALESHISFAAVVRRGLQDAVLKIPMAGDFAHIAGNLRFQEHEALHVWDGEAAVRLVEFDPATGAMLLERCVPGVHLADGVTLSQADEIAVELLHRLWRPVRDPHPFVSLDDYAVELGQRAEVHFERAAAPIERSLLDETLQMLDELTGAEAPRVLLHGDLHHKNILSAEREAWLAIDPLPRIGDPAYDAVQFLLFRKGDTSDPMLTWGSDIVRFCRLAGVDEDRVKGWIFVRLVTDALASLTHGTSVEELQSEQDDLWTARLVRRLL
jgi:streptomycin 6-kinase